MKPGIVSDIFKTEVEFFYFKTLESYLLHKPNLHSNYEILCDLFRKHPESFSILSRNDLLRLKHIQDDIRHNQFSLLSGDISLSSETIPRNETTDKRHQELCMELAKNKKLLEPFIGPVEFINLEHPTFFGPIDIMVISADIAYVLEIKTKAADHSIIGQTIKYFIGLSLQLILKLFDDVKIITICPGYDKSSYIGLKQIGARTLLISDNPLKIKELCG